MEEMATVKAASADAAAGQEAAVSAADQREFSGPSAGRREPEVYEVFTQSDHEASHQHVGSVLAASPDMALMLARENFLRRDPAVSLWVVPRAQICIAARGDIDLSARETDRSYRLVSGYRDNNDRWRKYRQQMIQLKELVRD